MKSCISRDAIDCWSQFLFDAPLNFQIFMTQLKIFSGRKINIVVYMFTTTI